MPGSTAIPHTRICDSCGDILQRQRTYIGFIGTTRPLYICEACACWHSSEQFVLYQIATARLTIRQAHRRLNAAAVAR